MGRLGPSGATLVFVRMLRRLVVMLAVFAGLALLANVFIVKAAEQKAGDEIRARLRLGSTPTVKIEGFPVLLHLLQGNIPRVVVDGRDADVQGLVVSSFHVDVRGLRARLAELRAGIKKLRVESGAAEATVTQDAANEYLAKQDEEGRVAFGDRTTRIRKHATYAGRPYLVEATGTLLIDGTDLVFRATTVTIDGKVPPGPLAGQARRDASFRVHLPAIPGGFRPDTVEVSPGRVRFSAAFAATTIDLSGS